MNDHEVSENNRPTVVPPSNGGKRKDPRPHRKY